MRVWYLLRTLDRDGCGRLDKREALDLLQHLSWSQASAYRLIGKGMGTFWREEPTHPHGTRGQRGTSPRKTLVVVGAMARLRAGGWSGCPATRWRRPGSCALATWLRGTRWRPTPSFLGLAHPGFPGTAWCRSRDGTTPTHGRRSARTRVSPSGRRSATKSCGCPARGGRLPASGRTTPRTGWSCGASGTGPGARSDWETATRRIYRDGDGGREWRSTGSRAGFGPMRVTQPGKEEAARHQQVKKMCLSSDAFKACEPLEPPVARPPV